MRITLQQTGSREDMEQQSCCICAAHFYLGPATCFAITETGMLMGEVCPACVEAGPRRIEDQMERRARWSRMAAVQDTRIADEGVTDCPSLDELLTAESFYGRPMFETHQEYDDAVRRGEVD